jgi:hypothetical protein
MWIRAAGEMSVKATNLSSWLTMVNSLHRSGSGVSGLRRTYLVYNVKPFFCRDVTELAMHDRSPRFSSTV